MSRLIHAESPESVRGLGRAVDNSGGEYGNLRTLSCMPRRPRPLPATLQGKVFTTTEARAAGLREHHLRTTAVRRVFRGMYADPALGPELSRLIEAAGRLLPKGAALSGWHAVHLWDLPLPLRDVTQTLAAENLIAAGMSRADADRIVAEAALVERQLSVCVPAGVHRDPRDYLQVSEVVLPKHHTRWWHGLTVLRPARLFLELAADGWDLVDLVCLLDAIVHDEREDAEVVNNFITWAERRRGVRLARLAYSLMDSGAESPMETRLRLILVLAGLPRPRANIDVYRGKRFVARPDLQYTAEKIAIEYDGPEHAGPKRRARDEQRRVDLRNLGWVVLTFTSEEVLKDPALVVSRVWAELDRRRVRVDSGVSA